VEKAESGADYAVYDGPVITAEQAGYGMDVIQEEFKDQIINLRAADAVIEAPNGAGPQLTAEEKAFEAFLGFHPEAIESMDAGEDEGPVLSETDLKRLQGVKQEVDRASNDLQGLSWRVNYLVERDGKTPCARLRYLAKDHQVTLNLHHAVIRTLVNLSRSLPALAGHWAVAMCLTEGENILPHLSAEAREDVLLKDAMAKLARHNTSPRSVPEKAGASVRLRRQWDFMHSADDLNSLLD